MIGLKGDSILEEQELLKGQKQNNRLLHLKQILPPFNSSAKTARSIYKMENLMFEVDCIDTNNLQNAIKEHEEGKGRRLTSEISRNHKMSPFFVDLIQQTPLQSRVAENEELMKQLAFLNYLFQVARKNVVSGSMEQVD